MAEVFRNRVESTLTLLQFRNSVADGASTRMPSPASPSLDLVARYPVPDGVEKAHLPFRRAAVAGGVPVPRVRKLAAAMGAVA